MRKKKKKPATSEPENLTAKSESSEEHLKYINKLDLQRAVLTKIVNSDLTQITVNTPIDPDSNPDSN